MFNMGLFLLFFTLLVWDFTKSHETMEDEHEKAVIRFLTTSFPAWWIMSVPVSLFTIVFCLVMIMWSISDVVITSKFNVGLFGFLLSHIVIIGYMIHTFGLILPLFSWALALTLLIFVEYTNIDNKDVKAPIFIYLFLISIVTMYMLYIYPIIGVGYILFLISDMILVSDRFIKPIDKVFEKNTITYYIGVGLITLGVIYYAIQGGVFGV